MNHLQPQTNAFRNRPRRHRWRSAFGQAAGRNGEPGAASRLGPVADVLSLAQVALRRMAGFLRGVVHRETEALPTFPGTSMPVNQAATVPSLRAALKRLYDIVFSLAGLVVLSPLFLVMAVLIKLADGGDIFYRQIRIGLQGRPFLI